MSSNHLPNKPAFSFDVTRAAVLSSVGHERAHRPEGVEQARAEHQLRRPRPVPGKHAPITKAARPRTAAIASLLFALAAAQPSLAAGAYWATVGAGCVPAGQTIESGLHFNTAGKTKFNPGKAGEIILTCPITVNVDGANVFTLSYQDPDGANFDANVIATLRRLNRSTGAVSSVEAINSSMSTRTTYGIATKASGCQDFGFDTLNYDYYVQVNMTRKNTLYEPVFGGVSLYYAVC